MPGLGLWLSAAPGEERASPACVCSKWRTPAPRPGSHSLASGRLELGAGVCAPPASGGKANLGLAPGSRAGLVLDTHPPARAPL